MGQSSETPDELTFDGTSYDKNVNTIAGNQMLLGHNKISSISGYSLVNRGAISYATGILCVNIEY